MTVRLPERLQLQQLLPGFLGLGLVGDPLPLQLPPGLLLQTLCLVSADGEETFLIYDE